MSNKRAEHPFTAVVEQLEAEDGVARDAADAFSIYLAGRQPRDVIDPRTVASKLRLPNRQLAVLFNGFTRHRVLRAEKIHECTCCGTFEKLDAVVEAKDDGDEAACPGGCGSDLTQDAEGDVLVIYRLRETPVS